MSHVLIAYAAGVLSFFAPCGTFLLPGFFAYAFKERGRLLLATWVFLAGFMTLFLPIGLGIHAIATRVALHRQGFAWFGGLLMIALAGVALSGRGPHIAVPSALTRPRADVRAMWPIYLLGIAFGFTVAGCTAPLLAVTLALAGGSTNFVFASAVLFAYAVGLGSPLLALAFAADRGKFMSSRAFHAHSLQFTIAGRAFSVSPVNAISAAALVILGVWFIVSDGTFYTYTLMRWPAVINFNSGAAEFLSRLR